MYLTLDDSNREDGTKEESKGGLWAVYTAHTHKYNQPAYWGGREEERKAVGIISGGATSDFGRSDLISAREASFPYKLIEKSLSIKVEVAKASVEDDRIHILNSIVGRSIDNINSVPPVAHEKYKELNNSLRGTFASSTASLVRASKEDDEEWNMMMEALSKGSTRGRMCPFCLCLWIYSSQSVKRRR